MDKRHFKRVHFLRRVKVETGGQSYETHCMDISLRGVLLVRPENVNWKLEQQLTVTLELSDEEYIAMNCSLVHIDEEAVTASNADATGGEPIFKDGKGIGRVTSGTYGYTVGMSLALGYIKSGTAAPGDEVEVMVLGQPHKGRILEGPPFDPEGEKLRA